MKANIHVISHPIVQYLSSTTKQNKIISNIKHQLLRQLGLFLIYETIRSWIETYCITIQQINYIKDIAIVDPKESYIILASTDIDLSLIQEAQYLLPRCNTCLINLSHYSSKKEPESSFLPNQIFNNYTKVIIITPKLNINYIVTTLHNLIYIKNIKIRQIRLACIYCETEKLIEINRKYPKLNIFTTKIEKDKG